ERSDERWVADISEFKCRDGKLYLAGIKDLHDRGLAGWSMGERQTTDLVVNALVMALGRRSPTTELIHHADHGTQGGINRSSQHLDMEVTSGTTARLDGDAYRTPGDAFAGAAADPPRCGAQVLGEDRRGPLERRGSGRVWCVGAGGHQVVPRAWRHAINPAHTAHGQVPVVR